MKRLLCALLIILTMFTAACATIYVEDGTSSFSESSESSNVLLSSSCDDTTLCSSNETTEESSEFDFETTIDDSTEDTNLDSEDSSEDGGLWKNTMKGQQDTDYHGYSAQELDDYFDDALFVGDSVANGLKLYKSMFEKDIFNEMTFHTGACYGFNNSLIPVTAKSVHPVYQGSQRTIWEMVSLTTPNKVFIGFGLNDFGCVTTNNIKKCLDDIISKIKAIKPDIQIIILSSGYFTKDGEKYDPSKNDYRICARQREYNQFVLEYCNEQGLDYIDVSNCFSDDYGYLDVEISSDNYCHPNIKHYHMWRDILYGYAADKINGNYANPKRMQ